MYVCLCQAVTDREVRQVIEHGARSVSKIGRMSGAGTECGQCRPTLERMLAEALVSEATITTDE